MDRFGLLTGHTYLLLKKQLSFTFLPVAVSKFLYSRLLKYFYMKIQLKSADHNIFFWLRKKERNQKAVKKLRL